MHVFNRYIHLFLTSIILLALHGSVPAQQVSFGEYTGEGLTMIPLMPEELAFGDLFTNAGVISIDLSEEEGEVVPFQIEGVAYLDVTVTLTPPAGDVLVLQGNTDYLNDPERNLPINIRMAYYNKGQESIDLATAKTQAIEVTGHTATFQIRRRPGGPPGPPPTPPHSGYTPPEGTAYLFIYGDLTVGEVKSGPYSGHVDIQVEYTTYE